jgi:aminoglycoside phosphotransferase (APT) family kinase protein
MEIDVSLVRRLIASQFPTWAHLAIRPVQYGGWDNRTFHLGDQMIVRLPSAAAYAAQVDKEHRWLPRLAPSLPLPIPAPLAKGNPGCGYPWHWSVYRWLDGEVATIDRTTDMPDLAATLAHFLSCLHRIDSSDGPAPGPHNFYRGGPLAIRTTISCSPSSTISTISLTCSRNTVRHSEFEETPICGPCVTSHGSAGELQEQSKSSHPEQSIGT